MDASAKQLRGNKLLIVLTASLKTQSDDSKRHVRGLEIWNELQKDLANRSTSGRQIIAEKAGHVIQLDEPKLIINAVRAVVEAVRNTQLLEK